MRWTRLAQRRRRRRRKKKRVEWRRKKRRSERIMEMEESRNTIQTRLVWEEEAVTRRRSRAAVRELLQHCERRSRGDEEAGMTEWERDSLRYPIKERESENFKIIIIQRRFWKKRLCFEVFKYGCVITVFKIFPIFTKLPLLYNKKRFYNARRESCVIENSFSSSVMSLISKT